MGPHLSDLFSKKRSSVLAWAQLFGALRGERRLEVNPIWCPWHRWHPPLARQRPPFRAYQRQHCLTWSCFRPPPVRRGSHRFCRRHRHHHARVLVHRRFCYCPSPIREHHPFQGRRLRPPNLFVKHHHPPPHKTPRRDRVQQGNQFPRTLLVQVYAPRAVGAVAPVVEGIPFVLLRPTKKKKKKTRKRSRTRATRSSNKNSSGVASDWIPR